MNGPALTVQLCGFFRPFSSFFCRWPLLTILYHIVLVFCRSLYLCCLLTPLFLACSLVRPEQRAQDEVVPATDRYRPTLHSPGTFRTLVLSNLLFGADRRIRAPVLPKILQTGSTATLQRPDYLWWPRFCLLDCVAVMATPPGNLKDKYPEDRRLG